jgi:tetratricopeptide (TPR) repeat protein
MSGKQAKGWQPEEGQWIVFRTDTQIQSNSVDIYVMLRAPTLYAYGFFLVQGEQPSEKDVRELMNSGLKKDGHWAQKLTLPKGDPAEKMFREIAELNGVKVDVQPSALLEPFAAPFKEGFARTVFSPAGMFSEANFKDGTPDDDKESARASIPDSYDPCPCASGKKYKFCCKKIFREVIMAMCAAEEGLPDEALKWMAKAQSVAGESAEVLCRYGIVYSSFDQTKASEYFEKCLSRFPEYPRAHYIRGIELKEKGDTDGALASYQKAIERYLPTDRYHLNEVWNNVGIIHFDRDEYAEAKTAWEKALVYLPSDAVVKRNLNVFIYTNPEIPEPLRKPSPFVERFMAARDRK